MFNKKAAGLSMEQMIVLLLVLAAIAVLLIFLYEPVKTALLNSPDLLA